MRDNDQLNIRECISGYSTSHLLVGASPDEEVADPAHGLREVTKDFFGNGI